MNAIQKPRTLLITGLVVALLAATLFAVQARQASCAYLPLLGEELLPNPRLLPAANAPTMPQGWGRGANGVELQGPAVGTGERGFDLDGDGRALQLLGIANFVETPATAVRPGSRYCFAGRALTDSAKGSPTRVQLTFYWLDAAGNQLAANTSAWQPVVVWAAGLREWSPLAAAFTAPTGAATLRVRLSPASDDRVYLDAMHLRQGGAANTPVAAPPPVVQPWPNGARAAVSFSFDWETAMGGLIHSRSDDPRYQDDPLQRGLRMRQGVTTTLDLFRPYGIRATYYANGYNFLQGNTSRRSFMGDPTFTWADATISKKWPTDRWVTRRWFADDPYGSVASDPAWYFGDLVALLTRERHDIQSHTFSHLDAGLARSSELRADLAAWRAVAAEAGVPAARSLAFPWSSSAGLSDADWQALAEAGITSVTRTNRSQPQYRLVSATQPHCRPVPGHESILACPDFYLTTASAPEALVLLDKLAAEGGMIDLWAHTEEVTAPDQVAAWGQVIGHAARLRDQGALWIAPLAEIADWQQALRQLEVKSAEFKVINSKQTMTFAVKNHGHSALRRVTLMLPMNFQRIAIDGAQLNIQNSARITIDVPAGATLEVMAWPA